MSIFITSLASTLASFTLVSAVIIQRDADETCLLQTSGSTLKRSVHTVGSPLGEPPQWLTNTDLVSTGDYKPMADPKPMGDPQHNFDPMPDPKPMGDPMPMPDPKPMGDPKPMADPKPMPMGDPMPMPSPEWGRGSGKCPWDLDHCSMKMLAEICHPKSIYAHAFGDDIPYEDCPTVSQLKSAHMLVAQAAVSMDEVVPTAQRNMARARAKIAAQRQVRLAPAQNKLVGGSEDMIVVPGRVVSQSDDTAHASGQLLSENGDVAASAHADDADVKSNVGDGHEVRRAPDEYPGEK